MKYIFIILKYNVAIRACGCLGASVSDHQRRNSSGILLYESLDWMPTPIALYDDGTGTPLHFVWNRNAATVLHYFKKIQAFVIISFFIYIVFEIILCAGSSTKLQKIKKINKQKIFEMISVTQLQICCANTKLYYSWREWEGRFRRRFQWKQRGRGFLSRV
jgi:hypothetical protein